MAALAQEAGRAQRELWPGGMNVVEGSGRMSMLSGAMPPPPGKRPSIRMLSNQLGTSGPLEGEETRDQWCEEPSEATRLAIRALRVAADHRVDTSSSMGAAGPSQLQTALGWLRRFVETFPSRRLFVQYNGSDDFRSAAYNEETAVVGGVHSWPWL